MLSAMRVPRTLLMSIMSESRRCMAAISAGGGWIAELVASTDPVGDSISSSAAETNSSIDVALKIFRTRCTCVGKRANHLDLRTSSEALFPAKERISRRSCEGFLSPSCSSLRSLWNCLSAESVNRCMISCFKCSYFSLAGGVSKMSWISRIVSVSR